MSVVVMDIGGKAQQLQVLNTTCLAMFRELSKEEEREFLDWAKRHWQDEVRATYHPVIQNYMLVELALHREKMVIKAS